ncbi:uncharacterized protein METZ01_LOCUS258373 [marine metagenome]|mgnify:CR=1 FL=1|uniref:Uncharacterized protein n=1 Tax=marine metagenome TaxID=408172 RepID=A0A382J1M4_9ZZZZ
MQTLINRKDISYKRYLLRSIDNNIFYLKTFGDEQFSKPIEVLFSEDTDEMVSSNDVKQLHLMGIASLDLYINQIRFEDSPLRNVKDDLDFDSYWPTQGCEA